MSKSASHSDYDGVSPVIGVVLIVATVVALVSLVTLVVFNMTDTQNDTASAAVQVTNSDGTKLTVQLLENQETSKVIVQTAGGERSISEIGEFVTVDSFGEQVEVVGVTEDGSRSVIRSINPAESGSTSSDDSNTTFVSPEDSTTAGSIDGNTYNTREAAENAVSSGDSIIIQSGVHRVSETVQATVSKDVTIGVQNNVIFECNFAANNGKVNLDFTTGPAVVNGAQNIGLRGCGSGGDPPLPPELEDEFNISLSDRIVESGSEATFSANISNIGQQDIESIIWDFGDNSGATGNTVTHTYSSTGNYTVTVEATSKEGTTKSATATYNVESSPSSVGPVAAFDYSPVGPTVDQQVKFNASDSTDQDGSVSSYE